VLRSAVDAAEAADDDVVATLRIPGGEFPVDRFGTLPASKYVHGRISAMALYAGTSVGAVTGRAPAADIVAELLSAL
jgi:hypothetical protein